ncbi:MAG: error-prone DNA polymerase, partial [Phycisphaerales bacterium]
HIASRPAYAALCQLLTLGKRRAPKGHCHLVLHDLLDTLRGEGADGMLVTLVAPANLDDECLQLIRGITLAMGPAHADRFSLGITLRHDGSDADRLTQAANLAAVTGVVPVALGEVLYHEQQRAPLQDILTCIRSGCTLAEAGLRLQPNTERYLRPSPETARLFAALPGAVSRTVEIAERCLGRRDLPGFSLDEIRYEYPDEVIPPRTTAMQHLTELCWAGARERYPGGVPPKVASQILHELKLIDELRFAHYFLTVHDLVVFARSRAILCQGRGAAANSAVCYCLGVTAVDPDRIDVLFERFVSKERREPPDIDIDFEHERREEVIQYLYAKYGRDRAALAAEVISYRTRSAVRDVGKALGLSIDAVDAIAKNLDWWDRGLGQSSAPRDQRARAAFAERIREVGLAPDDNTLRLLRRFVAEITGFPRHLSQHVGGFVITKGRLCDLVPIENAAMDDRTIIEWDKDDIDAAGLMKVDVLGLGMLTCVRKALHMVHGDPAADPLRLFAQIPPEDPAVYDMICAADTVGVFQIESRAQMSMLPRLRPRTFYDLVIEVAIVRPGPIQGDMVHPYLRRRNGEEPVSFPHDDVRKVLGKTLGVPLFQEQAMSLAIVAAGFTPGEADQLRRAIAAWKTRQNVLERFGERLVHGMVARGYPEEFALRCFEQIKGFSEYGFPESHAASFALIVYASAWLKHHHPSRFAAALINSQPMGFYAPAQIVQDAQRHGVTVLPIDVNHSGWDCTAGPGELRLGLRLIQGLGEPDGRRVENARNAHGRFSTIESLARAADLGSRSLRALAEADAFTSMGIDRQHALWSAAGIVDEDLPIFTPADRSGPADARAITFSPPDAPPSLPVLPPHTRANHEDAANGHSRKAHP